MSAGLRLWAAVWFLTLSACASIPYGVKAPAVSLADVALLGGDQFMQPIALSFRISNPNRLVLDVEGAHFTVDVDGRQFARGKSEQPFQLPPMSDMLVEVPAVSTLHDVLREIDIVGSAGGLRYEVSGDLLIGGYGALPFRHRGQIGSPGAPAERRSSYF